MALTYQQQQYYYTAEQRRKQAMYRYARMTARIRNIARFIAVGGDPLTDPNIKDEYYYLVNEFGEEIFTEAVNQIMLEMKGEQ